MGGGSISHTNSDPQAWWRVDLQGVYDVSTVRLFSRTDCCWYRLRDFYVHTSETPIPTNLQDALNDPNVTSTFYNGICPTGGEFITINSSARWVVVQLTGSDPLHLAEVEVYSVLTSPSVNLTVNNAPINATVQWSRRVNNQAWNNVVGATQLSYNAPLNIPPGYYQYRATLSSNSIYVTNPAIINCIEPLDAAGSIVGPATTCQDGSTDRTLTYIGNLPSVGDIQWQRQGFSGVYVDIGGATGLNFIPGGYPAGTFTFRAKLTSVCETVYTEPHSITFNASPCYPIMTPTSSDVCIIDPPNNIPLGNVALSKPTQQSSINYQGSSSRAVDGNTNSNWAGGSVSHTGQNSQAWWRVDLQGIYHIDYVRLYNRSDCCWYRLSNFYVHTSETPISTNLQDALNDPNVTSTFYSGQCPVGGEDVTINSSARWIVVQLTSNNYLALAEFEAYASIETHQPLAISNLPSYNSLQWSRNYNNTGWATISDAQNLEDYGEVYTAPGFYNYRAVISSNSIYTTDVSSVTVHAETVPGTISGPGSICLGAATGNTLTLTGSVGDIQWQQSSNSAGPYTDIAGATNTTYVVNTSSSSVSYYRAKVTSGTCGSLYTQDYEVTVAFCPNTWTGLQSTDWANGGNWSTGVAPQPTEDGIIPSTPTGGVFPIIANSVVVDDLVIEPGAVLTVATGGSITVTSELNSDGTVYVNNGGSLVQASGGTLVGTGTYHINRVGSSVYDYWSSPITNGSVSGAYQYNPLLGTYDPSDDLFDPGWVSSGSSMVVGSGYAAQGLGSRTFVGTINNGNVSAIVQYVSNPALSSNPGVAYNLVGNPYPSGLSLPSFVSANSSMLETAAVYLWDDPGAPPYSSSGYATWSTGGSVAGGGGNVPTNNIGSCQGFKVRVTGNGNLVFNNAMRVTDNPLILFRESEMNRLWLNVNSGVGSFNQTLVGFADDATEGVDFPYDAPKLDPVSDLSLYSLMGDEPYAIQFFDLSLPRIIPLGLAVAHDTPVTFSIGNEDNMQNHEILLEDRLLDVYVNLKDDSYQFQASTEQYLDRFYLHVIPPEVSGTEQVLGDTQYAVHYHNDRLYISNRENLDDEDAVVHLFDMSGRMVLEFTGNEVVGGHQTFDISTLQDGVYVVRVLNAGAEFSQKIMKY